MPRKFSGFSFGSKGISVIFVSVLKGKYGALILRKIFSRRYFLYICKNAK